MKNKYSIRENIKNTVSLNDFPDLDNPNTMGFRRGDLFKEDTAFQTTTLGGFYMSQTI